MEKLIDILRKAVDSELGDGWLYLENKEGGWDDASKGMLVDHNQGGVAETGLIETLANYIVEDIARAAVQIEPVLSDETLLDAFNYYWVHDAFLPEKNHTAPPPPSEADVRFYLSLGEERAINCKHSGCDRGAISLSVFCRIHHFEMIQQKPCPFTQ